MQPGVPAAPGDLGWYEKNPGWRLTEAGERAPTTRPWQMAALVFGVPFVVLVVLGFLLR